MQNQQTPMQNKRSLMQNQQACTELPLDGVHRGIRRIRFLKKKNKRTYPVENVPLTYRECFHARIQIFFQERGIFRFARVEVVGVGCESFKSFLLRGGGQIVSNF